MDMQAPSLGNWGVPQPQGLRGSCLGLQRHVFRRGMLLHFPALLLLSKETPWCRALPGPPRDRTQLFECFAIQQRHSIAFL